MTKRVLILVGIPNFDYDNPFSAVASYLKEIRAGFEQEGHHVEFAFEKDATDKGAVATTEVNKQGVVSKVKNVLRKFPWFYQSLVYRRYFKQQNALITDLKSKKPFDLVVEFHTVGSTVGADLAKHWGCKFSVIFDAPTEVQFFEMHGTKSMHWNKILAAEKRSMEEADRVMAYSTATKNHINKNYSTKNTIVILPSVVTKPYVKNEGQADGVFNIIFVGSFLVWHKVDQLVDAFVAFKKIAPHAKLQLIGFGQEWHTVKSKVDKLQLGGAIEMPGFVSEEELIAYKKNSTVAIMPGSNWYGSPLKLFEYGHAGIPFIAPTTPTVTDVFKEEEHCLYIDENNVVDSIVNALETLYGDPEKRKAMAQRANEYVMNNFEGENYQRRLYHALFVS